MNTVTLDLLRQVKAGKREASSLNGDEYQELVFEQLIDKLFDDPSVLSLEDHKRGEADYIVKQALGSGILAKVGLHYFECKNYSRSLELDNVAKIMVVAVAKQPDSVHVVSGTRLQPQVWNYASRLFDTGTKGNPIFRGVAFRHWQTNELLDFVETKAGEGDHESSGREHEVAWWLTECLPFSETEVSSSYSPSRKIAVPKGRLLHLAIALPASSTIAELVGLPAGCWTRIVGDDDGVEMLHYRIDTNHLDEQESSQISVRATLGHVDLRIPIGAICTGTPANLLPELRRTEVKKLFEQIGPSGKCRLVLVNGEAGVGKTHFIERVAEDLRSRCSFDVLCFTVTEDNQDDLLTRVVRDCLTPPLDRTTFRDLALAVQSALLSDEFETRRLESNIGLLARIASRMGQRVIVIRDCQYLSERVANQLWTLIVALNDASWGGLRLFLEYRQPEAAANLALMSLVEKINLKIMSVLSIKNVLPLTEHQFASMVNMMFTSITPEITDCLVRRTGGLPLFIDNYLRRLLDLGLVCQDAQSPAFLRIDQPAQILADTLPEGGQLILEARVRNWLSGEFAEDADIVAIELALLAIADEAPVQACIRRALSMSPERLEAIRRALDRGGMGREHADGYITFRHDLFRSAITSVAKSISSFALKATTTVDRLAEELAEHSVQLHALRARLFELLEDHGALERELRQGVDAAYHVRDYGHLVIFLSRLLDLLPVHPRNHERYDFKMQMAWALWESDSLLVARQRYLEVAEEAERNTTEDFSISEAVATDAYRRAIGIDLELMEPVVFLKNAIAVLKRRQTLVTFNSIINRLVLFCARFGFPQAGYRFAKIGFAYIGNGKEHNEGAVLCSEVGSLYSLSAPNDALSLFRQGVVLATDDVERAHGELNILVLESLHKGADLDLSVFSKIWKSGTKKRHSEVLTRASLLRGSLFLRAGDLQNARIWISRTATMVMLYHRRDAQLSILNDQLVLSILERNWDEAKRNLVVYAKAFGEVVAQYDAMLPLVDEAYFGSCDAAKKLRVNGSPLVWPNEPPPHCGQFGEMWNNIAWSADKLSMADVAKQYDSRPAWLQDEFSINPNRYVNVADQALVLGAY